MLIVFSTQHNNGSAWYEW